MSRASRLGLIKKIETSRNSKVLSYIGATRQGLGYDMKQTDARIIYDHLLHFGKVERIDLILNSFGGSVTFSWRLVNLIREFSKEFNVIVPFNAFSAATLISMGADSIVMLPSASLGPTDPSSTTEYNPKDGGKHLPINVEEISSYISFIKEDFEIKSEEGLIESLKILSESEQRLHPLALGAAKRGTKLATKYAHDLLASHLKKKLQKEKVDKIVKTFSSELFAHDHPINREEAKQHGLNVVIESKENEKTIWDLFKEYEEDMKLNEVFNPIFEFKSLNHQIPLSVANNVQPITKAIPEVKNAIIESEKYTDTNINKLDVTALKFLDGTGNINETYSWIVTASKWNRESS